MNLTDTVKRMAELARLEFPEKELDRYTGKAQAVLTYVEKLNELNTDGIEPTSHAIEAGSIEALRRDELCRWPDPQDITELAPERDGPFIQVPRIIE